MSKKVASIVLATAMAISSLLMPASSFAADYTQTLKNKGFTDSYIPYLTQLHSQYPNWDFQPLITGVDFQTAVMGERSKHSKQLIQKSSSKSTDYYCNCADCFKNGAYVVQEGSNWVSASESAVKYYMDPRNWMNSSYIYQFESTAYNTAHTKAGVEAILAPTWMHNSLITYYSTDGVTQKTYDNATQYSDAIINAAQTYNLSAYYLASRIVQEVGGASPTAGGARGTQAPFQGIYNYFNIGANTGAMDGLEWASGFLKANSAAVMYSDYSSGNVSGSQTPIAAGQTMTWRANSGNYYKVRLYTYANGKYTEGATGYILKSACRTTYFNFNRPWTNPYKAIIGGAQYIASSFASAQNTGYLQKFNVNPASNSMYNNEYMANVGAPSAEALNTCKAYAAAGTAAEKKSFIIPVYNNLPSEPCTITTQVPNTPTASDSTRVTGLTLTARTTTSLTYKWNAVAGAEKYYVYIKNETTGKSYNKTVTSASAKITGLTTSNKYAVKVKAYVARAYGPYSSYNTKHTLPSKVSSLSTSSRSVTKLTVKWKKQPGADYYYIYQYSPSKKKYSHIATVSGNETTYKISKLKGGTYYYYAVSAVTIDSKTKIGTKSSKLTTCTNPAKVSISSAKSSSKKKITVKWKESKGSGYQIKYSTSSKFKSNNKTINVSGSKTKSKTIKASKSKKTYYVKVRAYKTIGKTKYYSNWSSVKKVKTK